jgi:hypothetical protein
MAPDRDRIPPANGSKRDCFDGGIILFQNFGPFRMKLALRYLNLDVGPTSS